MRVPEATSHHECAPDDNDSNEDEGAKYFTLFPSTCEGSAGKTAPYVVGPFSGVKKNISPRVVWNVLYVDLVLNKC